ncbi:hypothetical protein CDD81_8068 [Ophiocordyceps australis]|uniref:Uncharacterized protein n=1 Tax=Ophiocordyceps australis TaxID=1399860 RepID=A0A2C5XYY1_9HYPO|nr:hypothetical protein CDD81_8068 [Ophiocordyceps australis]
MTAIFAQAAPSIYQSSKCFVTYGSMAHIDPKQPPQCGHPWANIAAQRFVHKVDIIAPQACYEALYQKLVQERQQPSYARVTMTLGQILDQFLISSIKQGDVSILSEGNIETKNVFSIRHGTLDMFLDRETYERAGLQGKPYGAKGNRGVKPRWVVSLNLKDARMLPGLKGFDRLMSACENVLKEPLEWLLCNANACDMTKHKHTDYTIAPSILQSQNVAGVTPDIAACILAQGDREMLEERATELYEWLSLVRLQSPRIAVNNNIDPFLSRYKLPADDVAEIQVCMFRWQGFLSASWLQSVVMDALTLCSPQQWISFSATAISQSISGDTSEFSLLRPSGTAIDYLMWEIK